MNLLDIVRMNRPVITIIQVLVGPGGHSPLVSVGYNERLRQAFS